MDKREQVNRDNSANHSARSLLTSTISTSKISTNVNHTRRGFAIAPILYLLGLIGVGAGILFSGYSQILRSNIQMTNDMTVKSDIQSIGTTMAAASVLSSTGSPTVLCPPGGSNASSACSSTANWTNVLQGAQSSNMPASYATINSAGNPKEWGVFQAAKGYKQLDPYGHYYMVCRWEQQASDSTDPALMVISAGPNGTLETTCGNTSAQGDDTMILLTAVQAEQRAAIWQVKPDTHSSSEAVFGQTGSQLIIDSMGNLTVPGATTLSSTLAVTGTTTLTSNLIGNAGATFTNTVTAANFSGSIAGLSGVFNAVTVGSTGQLTVNSSGNVATTGTLNAGATTLASNAVTGAETIGGTLGVTGATTLSGALTAKGATALGSSGQLTVDTSGDISTSGSLGAGAATLGSTSMASSAVAGNETVGGTDTVTGAFTAKGATALGSSGQLTVDASGDVSTSGTFHDAGATTLGGTLNVSGTTSLGGALSGTSAVFSGTVQAANFNGNATTATTAGNVTGVVSIANGGTGQTTASAALIALGGNNASNLTTGTVGVGLLPYSGVVAGTYNWGTVDSYGRVTYANNVSTSSITDGSGDSVTTSSSNGGTITFNDANSPAMTINGGNVGIGTTSPGTKLDVNGNIRVENAGAAGGTATPNQLQLMTGAASERWGITTDGTAESGSAVGSNFALVDYNNSGALLGTPFSINRNTNAATFTGTVSASQFNGSGNGLTSVPASSITGTVTANVALGASVTANNPQINGQPNTGFYTPSASTIAVTNNGVESMRWASNGHVGIGTTTPGDEPLSVGGGVYVDFLSANSGSIANALRFGGNTSGQGIGSKQTAGGNQYGLDFYTGYASRMSITSSGNVGIGTASPGSPLSVVGNSALTSGTYIASQIGGTQTVASTGSYYGLNVNPSFSLASGNTLAYMLGVEVNPSNASTGTLTQLEGVYTAPANYGTMVNLMGGYNQPQNNGSGNVSTMWGTYSQPYHQSSGAVGSMFGEMAQPIKTGTGAVTSMYGVYSQCQNTNATGAVTNCFDEYLDTPYGTGTFTNKFGIYQVDANSNNYFGGKVGIGTASPTQLLDVNGGIHFVASTTNYSSQGGFLEWNQSSGGGGETDFINAKGSGTGGFAFYNVVDGATSLGTPSIFINGSGNVGIGTGSPNAGVALDLGSNTTAANSSLLLPIGSTATRPTTGIPGMIRYNSSLSPAAMELYSNSAWSSVITAATVGNSNIFLGTSVTANNPQINGDASTGLYTPAASTVAITTAGVERLRVNGSGNVGIGTTNPGYGVSMTGGLTINGTGGTVMTIQNNGTNSFAFNPGSSGNAWTMYDYAAGSWTAGISQKSGNVGIGTTAPGAPLQVNTTTTGSYGVAINAAAPNLAQGTTNADNMIGLNFGKAPQVGSQSAWLSYHYDTTAANSYMGFGHWGTSELMVITQGGNVGIGTTTPPERLTVSDGTADTSNNGALVDIASTTSNAAAIRLLHPGVVEYTIGLDTSNNLRIVNTNGSQAVSSSSAGITMTSGGNVTVSGTLNVTGAETVSGTLSPASISTGSITMSGNLTFTAANPSITSGGSYIVIPNGMYISGSSIPFYTQAIIEARGGIANDQAAYLTINGGTSGYTYFAGSVGIGTGAPAQSLDVTGLGRFQAGVEIGASGAYEGFNIYFNNGWKYRNSDYGYIIRHDGGDLGFYAAPSGTAGATASVTAMMGITSTGVGIGTTSPSANLHVVGKTYSSSGFFVDGGDLVNLANGSTWYGLGLSNLTLTTNYPTAVQLAGYGGLNFQTAGGQMVMLPSGNVGIGTTSPQAKLHDYGNALIDNGSGDGLMRSLGLTVETVPGGNYSNGTDPGDGLRGLAVIAKGSTHPAILTLRNLDNGSGFWDFVLDPNDGNKLKFSVAGSQPAMTVTTSGNVGIGTTSPGAQLQVNGASTSYPALSVGDTTGIDNGATYGMVNLTRAADTTRAHLAFIRSGSYVWQMGYVSGTNTFGIFPWNFSGTQGTPTMAFSGANVGIGTTTPGGTGSALQVNGTLAATSGFAGIGNAYINRGVSGGGVEIGYDTTNNIGELFVVKENVAWEQMNYNAGSHYFYINGSSTPTFGITSGTVAVTGNLTISGTFSPSSISTSTLTVTSGLVFPANSWMYAPGGVNRNWYIGPADMYWEIGGNGSFHFRNSSDSDIAYISYNGVLTDNGETVNGTATVNGSETVSGNLTAGTTAQIRPLTVNGEISQIGNTGGTAYYNVSDSSGSNGGNYSLVIRGLGSNGGAQVNLANLYVQANTTTVNGNLTVSGNGTFPGGAQIGNGISTGFYADGTNLALRTPGTNTIYFQNSGGATTFGTINSGGLNIGTGNLSFSAANPYISSAGSYIIIPNGLYVSGGTLYSGANIEARSGIANDAAASLTINGGTSGWTYFTGNVGIGGTPSSGYTLYIGGNGHTTGNWVVGGSFAIGGAGAPNGYFDVRTNGTNDGIVMYQPTDNQSTIQSYIDGHWSDRTTYGGPCCNQLNIETDTGNVVIGNTLANSGIALNSYTTVNNSMTVTGNLNVNGTISGTVNYATNAGSATNATNASAANVAYSLSSSGDNVSTSGWYRSNGAVGWYNNTYGCGWYMSDTSAVREYGGCALVSSGAITGTNLTLNNGGIVFYNGANVGTGQLWNDTWVHLAADNAAGQTMALSAPGGVYFRNTSGGTSNAYISTTGGQSYFNGSVLSGGYYLNSDARLKHDIQPDAGHGLATVDQMRSVHFKWNKDDKADYGVIAQEVQKLIPEAVATDAQGFLEVQYDKLVLPVIEAVKELHALVKDLQAKVAALLEWQSATDKRLDAMQKQIDDLTARNRELERRVK